MRLETLAGKRLAVLGYGREGRCALAVLAQRLPETAISVLVERGERPSEMPGWTGPFDRRLTDFDVLIRSPGIPVDHPALAAARAAGVAVVNPASIWLAERQDVKVIGVTGSKGKSTTASLLAHLLMACEREVLLAGNIGEPLLGHLDTTAEFIVLELSSYQLADIEGAIALGLITRLFDEHLDWHGSREAYFASKLRIARLLAGRPLLVNGADTVLMEQTSGIAGRIVVNQPPGFWRREDVLYRDQQPWLRLDELGLSGRHNLDNAAMALTAAQLLGVSDGPLRDALVGFQPLPHRLERLPVQAGRAWVNDSISTSPHATRAALESLRDERVTLIAGGLARPADWQAVIDWCQARPLAGLVVLPDNGAQVAAALIEGGAVRPGRVEQVADMSEAVSAAVRLSATGGVVLLSPGAPSFPRFRDFEERGAAFRTAVAAYSDRSTA
ncbi:MAG: UDP-N-acetylmuramoyl-L-alanine--D-glutamate ligase [Wenzhouxiangella sp.]|nr:UDP-N-acetylmuramoyl-L-alanine--D-glutamate ligase [Wenzhouxiangella sp.]MCH8476871.1 UDP-N-acetylmuramoyl-L-alanine--D-glutamate ligase [Wenzhouxiangella sp.]TVR94807.1 MAG: UDP-N-acetylmuramoyl-L-alanine--D-glutamate ligase [Wenzhouxiangellaceae bacterium]